MPNQTLRLVALLFSFALGLQVASAGYNSWSSKGPGGGYVQYLAVAPSDSSIVLALGTDSVFKSTDRGATWTWSSTGLIVGGVGSAGPIAFDPSTTSIAYMTNTTSTGGHVVAKSTDGGATWNDASIGLPSPGSTIESLLVDPQSTSDLFLLEQNDGMFKSTDAGSTWAAVPAPNSLSPTVSMTIAFGTQDVLLGGTNGAGLFASTDGGSTWTFAAFPSKNVFSMSTDPSSSAVVYAGVATGFLTDGTYKSTDGGATWTLLNSQGFVPNAFDSGPPGILYVYGRGFTSVFMSTDAGVTWAPTAGPTPQQVGAFAVSQGSPATLLMGTDGSAGIYKSTDSGTSWTASNSGFNALSMAAVAVAPSNPLFVYGGADPSFWPNGVFVSTDGGATWPRSALSGTYIFGLTVDPNSPTTAYAFGQDNSGGGPYRTTDAGLSWSPITGGLGSNGVTAIAVDSTVSANLFAISAGAVVRSTDAGLTWNLAENGITLTGGGVYTTALAASPSASGLLYVDVHCSVFGCTDGGVFQSSDGASTWNRVNTGFYWATILTVDPLDPSTLYAAGGPLAGPLSRSTDGGATWSSVPGVPSNLTATSIADSPTMIMAAFGSDGIFASADRGATWSPLMTGLTARFVSGLSADSTGSHFHAATSDSVFDYDVASAALASYYTLVPCRAVDTRRSPGPTGGPALSAGTSRSFPIGGGCGVPATAKAVAVNLTVVAPGNAGDLRIYPDGSLAPNASSINFRSGLVRANNALAILGAGGAIAVQTDMASGSTNLLVDVVGYFQ